MPVNAEQQRGREIRVCLSLGRHETPSSGFWVYARELLWGLNQVLLLEQQPVRFQFTVRCQSEDRFLRQLEGLSSEYFAIEPLSAKGRRVLDALSLSIDTSAFDIFHGTSNQVPPRGTAKKVVTMHDLIQPFPAKETLNWYTRVRALYYRALFRGVFRWSDLVITGHPKSEREIACVFPYSKKVVVMPPCLSREFLQVSSLQDVERKYILCFSSSDPRKNLSGALRAFASLDGSSAPPLVLLVSTPEVKERYQREARALGLEGRVEYRLGVSADEIPTLYREAICSLFPSFAEGFGYPIYESLSQGTPVVTSDGLLLPEYAALRQSFVEEVQPGEIKSIANGIQNVLNRSFTLSERNQAREAVQSRLQFGLYAKRLLALYLELLDIPAKSRIEIASAHQHPI